MTYKAQLVVRASTKEGVEIIDQVKELASEKGLTFSDMAVELLDRALRGDVSAAAPAPKESAPKAAPAPAKAVEKVVAAPVATPKTNGVAADDEQSPLTAEEAGPPVDPSLPPNDIVRHYLRRREERGERAAARILVDFFAVAGPADGGKVKKLLLKEFSDSEFENLMKPIKATDEYATYTERAIFGTPSPYSK